MPTQAQIQERMPVWEALSEFFLDTELEQEDLDRIAGVLAASGYSESKLYGILRHEVYPPCSLNLVCVAGEWACWGEDWIRERIAPRYDHRPVFHLPAFLWSGIARHWDTVREIRALLRHGGGGHPHQARAGSA